MLPVCILFAAWDYARHKVPINKIRKTDQPFFRFFFFFFLHCQHTLTNPPLPTNPPAPSLSFSQATYFIMVLMLNYGTGIPLWFSIFSMLSLVVFSYISSTHINTYVHKHTPILKPASSPLPPPNPYPYIAPIPPSTYPLPPTNLTPIPPPQPTQTPLSQRS